MVGEKIKEERIVKWSKGSDGQTEKEGDREGV